MNDQLSLIIDEAEKAGATRRRFELPDPTGPQVIFPSEALTLTREQEDMLVQTAIRRKEQIEDEMGVNSLGQGSRTPNQFVQLRNSWMGKRELCDKMYEGDVAWRETAFPRGSIFEGHNINLPMTRKIVQQQYSRAQNYFFEIDPWFAVRPMRQISEELSERHESFLKFKAKTSDLKSCFNTALKRAFINGEAVLKGAFQTADDIYEEVAEVAVDAATGEPLIAGDGDYVFRNEDRWIPLVHPETGEWLNLDMEPASDNDRAWVLARHPQTVKPDQLRWSREKIRRQLVHYKGADLDLVYYQDFLCPLNARSVDEADCVVHLYDAPVVDLVQKYMVGSDGAAISDPRFLDMIQKMAGNDGLPKVNAGKRFSDGDAPIDRGDPVVRIGEFYMHIHLGDGLRRNIMMVLDLDTRQPIYYDYVARVTSDGRRPFRVLRVNPVENLWYGSSQVGLFWGLQELLDLSANRLNKSQSDSGKVTFWNPSCVMEGDNNPRLRLNNGGTYTLKTGFTPEQALSVIYLQDIKHDILMRLMETVQQFGISLAGVTSANDSAMAGLDSTKLATGIKHLEKVGQEMFGPLLDDLIPGVQDAVEMFFKITVANMDDQEVFSFFKEGKHITAMLKPEEIRDLDYQVELELSTYRGEQELAQLTAAIDMAERFYSMMPEAQQYLAPLFRRCLKRFQIENADAIISPLGAPITDRPRSRQISEDVQPRPNRPEPLL